MGNSARFESLLAHFRRGLPGRADRGSRLSVPACCGPKLWLTRRDGIRRFEGAGRSRLR
jgi:hypothetical protein